MTDIQATPDRDAVWHSGRAFIILPPSEEGGKAAAEPVFFPRPCPVHAIWLKESGPVQRTGA
ncbi:hypothetical protein GCM10007928_25990 [Sulfitobacter porphyrae]|jgi:hypothetical protein|nr:hypothetical protein GCM10007928_25990 [Sulfitobacter porphyrae]